MPDKKISKSTSYRISNTLYFICSYQLARIMRSKKEEEEITLFEGNTGFVSNSSKRITFNWTQTFGEPIVFELDKILFSNGTVLLS